MIKNFDKDLLAFILAHEEDDLAALALKASNYPDIDMPFALQQIRGRQKIKRKLPTWYQHTAIYYPVKVSIEQSSSELTAQYKAGLLQGESITDLTGGMGVDAYFFSQVCDRVLYVEKDEALSQISKINFKSLSVDNITVRHGSAEDHLKTAKDSTACYYLDPARRDKQNNKLVALEDCQPQVSIVLSEVLKRGGRLLVKTSPLLDIKSIANNYPSLVAVHCVAVDNECKELLFDFRASVQHQEIQVHAVNLFSDHQRETEEVSFGMAEEAELDVSLEKPLKYLYEPNAAIMKSGGYKSIAKAFKLLKLHAHTHLYTSNELILDFPGRAFEIKAFSKANRKALMTVLQVAKANITVRNFPSSVEMLRKKLKLKDGGSQYLFACTLIDNSHVILVCEKA